MPSTVRAKTRASRPEECSHSQTHPLTFGPLGWRAVLGLLWMLMRRKKPLILVGVRTKATARWRAHTREVGTEVTASSMQVKDEKALSAEIKREIEARGAQVRDGLK